MISFIRRLLRKNLFVRKFFAFTLFPSGVFDKYILNYQPAKFWTKRIDDVVRCPDNAQIPRVKNAGEIIRGKQVMHNGILVNLGSYYGPEVSVMLKLNKGVHEPQEEWVFQEVLKIMPENACMIELGSFWSFYSMWFNTSVKGARNFMVEPDKFNLASGIKNFKINKLQGTFINAGVEDKAYKTKDLRLVSVDSLVEEYSLKFIHLLHSDIQGYEFKMLNGAKDAFKHDLIGYVFISTHNTEVHQQCKDFLLDLKYEIIAEASLNDTYSEDGLLVAYNPNCSLKRLRPIEISLKSKHA